MGLMEGFPAMAKLKAAPVFDLQAHSTHSDGTLAPAEVVGRAAAAGVELFALTDHDTLDGVPEALAAARELTLIPAVELSSVHGTHEDLHVLGYALDHTDATLLETLADFRADRVRRIFAMADRLRERGFRLDEEFFDRPAPGRPHLGQGLEAGNPERLRRVGLETRDQLFAAYLVPGVPTYVARSRPTVQDAIDVI